LFIFDLMSINFFYNCSSPRHRWPLKWPTIMAQPFDFGIDRSAFLPDLSNILFFLPIAFNALSKTENTLGEAK